MAPAVALRPLAPQARSRSAPQAIGSRALTFSTVATRTSDERDLALLFNAVFAEIGRKYMAKA
jgi:hypothetical protein